MTQTLARGEAANLIADPLFRLGHDTCRRGLDRSVQRDWEQAERRAYGLGYDFALWLQNEQQQMLPLSRGGIANAEAVAALICADQRGALSGEVA